MIKYGNRLKRRCKTIDELNKRWNTNAAVLMSYLISIKKRIILNQIFSNKVAAKLGYTSIIDYYLIVYEKQRTTV